MRHLGQPQVLAQLGEVVEDGDGAAVVGLEEGLHRQDGEQLRLGEVPAAGRAGIGRQGLAAEGVRLARDLPQ
jgi:hypothetical protein